MNSSSYIQTPLFLVAVTFFAEILVARLARIVLGNLSQNHHYHDLSEEKKNSIATQIAMIPPRLPIFLCFLPLFGLAMADYTTYHTALLDEACTIYLCTYLFEASHRVIDNELLMHHFVSIVFVLFMHYLRTFTADHVPFTLLFVPFFIPGIVFGDTFIDLASLTYSLAPRSGRNKAKAVSVLWVIAALHLAARLYQWWLLLSYAFRHWAEIDSASRYGAQWLLPLASCFWAKMEFTDAYILTLFPRKLQNKQESSPKKIVQEYRRQKADLIMI